MKNKTTDHLRPVGRAGGWLGLVCVLVLGAGSARAQYLSTEEAVEILNAGYDEYDLNTNGSNDGSATTASYTQSFTGKNRAGATETMTFQGTATASAQYGQLHSVASGTVTNTYYNATNPVYYNSVAGTVNPMGSPDQLSTIGFANFTDTLQFGGALQAGYRAMYIFHVDGTNSGYGTGAGLAVSIAGNTPESFFDFDPGNVDTNWATMSYAINGQTPQTISVQFSDQFQLNTEDVADGSAIMGTANFAETATLAEIVVVDANGNPVSGVTVTSDSGTIYSVPEPATLACLLPGALWLIARARKPGAMRPGVA